MGKGKKKCSLLILISNNRSHGNEQIAAIPRDLTRSRLFVSIPRIRFYGITIKYLESDSILYIDSSGPSSGIHGKTRTRVLHNYVEDDK